MRNQLFLAPTAIAFFASACSHLPQMPEDPPDTADLLTHIKCEFRDAIKSDPSLFPFLRGWNTLFVLTLETDEKGTLSTNASLAHPIIPTLFSLPLTGEASQNVTRTQRLQFAEPVPETVKDADTLWCPDLRRSPLHGKLGFADLFMRARLSADTAAIKATQFDYTLDFAIVKNASVAPKWTMIPLRGRDTMEAGFKWTGNREHTHTLQLTLKPDDREKCALFPEFFAVYKKCPSVHATMDEARRAQPPALALKERNQLEKRLAKGVKTPSGSPTVRGISQDTLRDLQTSGGITGLENTLQKVRRRESQ